MDWIQGMRILAMVPVIEGVIIVIAIIVYAIKPNKGVNSGVDISMHMPDGEEYKDKIGTNPNSDYRPDIADQFDGRLTNIFRNPWKGIL